jgi:hypothetical protein
LPKLTPRKAATTDDRPNRWSHSIAAKVTDRLFDVSDIVRLLEALESKKAA